jgi:hypothetical protein
MMWIAARPPLSWSKVANCRAASVGAMKPGRCATMKPMRFVCAAAWLATSSASGLVECQATSTRSKPAASWAWAKRTT